MALVRERAPLDRGVPGFQPGTITMADKDTYLISIPSDLKGQVEAEPDGDCSWMLVNGGL